jgi:hypothetical protein
MNAHKLSFATTAVVTLCLLLLGSFSGLAQEKKDKKEEPKREYIEATASGTGTQMGRMINVSIIIYEYSPPEDQQALREAFNKAGQEGLVNALSKMRAKGRMAITGTLGYDINYIRQFPTENGRKVRLVTDRPIRFGELWSDSRSMEYSLSAVEIDLSNVKDKSTGTLLPAVQLKLDKNHELQLEAYQNPWHLVNIRVSD